MAEKHPRMIVSTSKKVLLLQDGIQRVIHEGEGIYYGVTWSWEHIFVVSRGLYPERVNVFDDLLDHVGTVPFSKLGDDPHQAFYLDNCLYIADRSRWRVTAWDFDLWNDFTAYSQPREEHINSVWCDGNFFYVVEHRHNRMPKKIKLFSKRWNQVSELNIQLKPQDEETGCGLHNVYVEGRQVYTLAPTSVVSVDCSNIGPGVHIHSTRSVVPEGIIPGEHYLRGLARLPGRFYVGVSNFAEREFRGTGPSWILVLDDSFSVIDWITLPDTGQVLEVRVIDGVDLAHNQVRCPYV